MRTTCAWVLLGVLAGCGLGDEEDAVATRRDALTEVSGFGSNPGGLSLFIHEPAGLGPGAPLVVALHGCTQSAQAYVATGWSTVADERGFLVAYPQTSGNAGCFEWFAAAQQVRGGPQVTSILQMVQHLVSTKGLDASRVYVTGASAGAAMTSILLATASDVFAAGAPLAGGAYGCATNQLEGLGCMSAPPNRTPDVWGDLVRAVAQGRPAPRVSLWHGTADLTVAFANLEEQVEQWTDVAGIDATPDATASVGSATHRRYTDALGVTRVEAWSFAGLGHAVPVDLASGCGTAAPYMADVGLCASRRIADFFGLTGNTSGDGGAGGGGGTASDGGAGGGAGGGSMPPTGCGCSGIPFGALGLATLALLHRRRRALPLRR